MQVKDVEDNKIAAFIIKNMLNYNKLDLNKIKAAFQLDDFGVREALIRLYKDNKVFGRIVNEPDGRAYLVFSMDEIQKKQLNLEDIIDWDLKEFELVGQGTTDVPRVENLKSLMGAVADKSSQSQHDHASKRTEHDQKDLISVEMTVKIVGIKTAVIIVINNASDYPATEGKMRLRYNDSLTIRPQFEDLEYEEKKGEVMIFINELAPKQSETLRIYVYNIIDRKFEIDGFFQFRNNKYTMRFIKMEQIQVDFSLPEIKEFQLPVSEIKSTMRDPDIFKRMQGVGCPDLRDPAEAIQLFEEILEKQKFQAILKHNDPTPMWFYSCQINGPQGELPILAIPQVKNNFCALYVSCKNKTVVSTLIHNLMGDFQRFLINRKFLPHDYQLIDLNCPHCQTVLPMFPPQGEAIKCIKCGHEQTPW